MMGKWNTGSLLTVIDRRDLSLSWFSSATANHLIAKGNQDYHVFMRHYVSPLSQQIRDVTSCLSPSPPSLSLSLPLSLSPAYSHISIQLINHVCSELFGCRGILFLSL